MTRKAIRTGVASEDSDSFFDFSDGVVGYVSDAEAPIRHLHRANNVTFDRRRALGIRGGFRDVTDYVLPSEPHSLMKFYATGGNKVFVGTVNSKIYSLLESTGYAEQTLPFSVSANWWHPVNINGVLVAVQEGGSNPPMAFNGTSWLSLVYPFMDSSTLTLTEPIAGSVDAGVHRYRIRWLFANGASQINNYKEITSAGAKNVNIAGIANSSRSDYIGFQVERTKVGDTSTYWFVGTVLSTVTTTFSDTASDASLGTVIPAQPGPYGSAPHFENLTVYRNRLIGTVGGNLWPGQAVADTEAPGVGAFNFNSARVFPASEVDDGDPVVTWSPQVDRMVFLKGKSLHALAGYDLQSFFMTPLHSGAGAAGTRAACSHGPVVYFYDGDDRLFALVGSTVQPVGTRQVGHYLKEITAGATAQSKVVLKNWMGRRILVCYPSTPSTFNNEIVAIRTLDGRYEHYTNMRVADALVHSRRDDFAGATMLFADPLVQPASTAQAVAANPNFVVWNDGRSAPAQIYAQKLNSDGSRVFAANGVPISAAVVGSGYCRAASDPSGANFYSVYTANQDGVASRQYLQKIDAGGALQFGTGILAGSLSGKPNVCVNAAGDVFVVTQASAGTSVANVQKYNSLGVPQWGAGVNVGTGGGASQGVTTANARGILLFPWGNGVMVAFNYYFNPNYSHRVTILDGTGAFLAGWTSAGSESGQTFIGATDAWPGIAQASDGAAFILRMSSGNALTLQRRTVANVATTSPNIAVTMTSCWNYAICGDATGGCYVAYIDKTSLPMKLYLARFDSFHNRIWGPILLWTFTSGVVQYLQLIQDGAGGVILSWDDQDGTGGTVLNVHLQRVDLDGTIMWGGGVNPTSATGAHSEPYAVYDGAGGAIVYWAAGTLPNRDTRAQRVQYDGNLLWGASGVLVGGASGDQSGAFGAFTGAPEAQIPPGAAAGYHIWSAFDGTSDARPRLATLPGDKIAWYAELPESDAGEADTLKQYLAIEVHPRTGLASVNANIRIDQGAKNTAVPVQVNAQGARWTGTGHAIQSDTLYWGPADGSHPTQPHTWGGESTGVLRSGIPGGLRGRKHVISIATETDEDLGIDGVVIDYRRLPDRTFATIT